MGFAAYQFGASPEAISVTAVCWSGPPMVLTAFTGGLTDRFGPRIMLIIGYLCSAAASLGMATAGSLMFLDVMAAACGAARSLCSPASSALPARVVASDDLLAANSLLGVTSAIGQVAGPLAASVLIATTGFRVAFAADAATYLVGALVVFPLPLLPRPDETGEAGTVATDRSAAGVSWLRTSVAGAAAVAGNPGLRRVALAWMGVAFTAGAFPGRRAAVRPARTGPAAIPVRVVRGRHRDRGDRDRPGSSAHSPPAAACRRLPPPAAACRRLPAAWSAAWSAARLLAAGAISYGLAAALFTGTPWVPVAYFGAFAWGAGGTVFYTVAATTLQRLAPAGPGRGRDLQGRVGGRDRQPAGRGRARGRRRPAAVAGLRPAAVALAAVAVAAGAACLLG